MKKKRKGVIIKNREYQSTVLFRHFLPRAPATLRSRSISISSVQHHSPTKDDAKPYTKSRQFHLLKHLLGSDLCCPLAGMKLNSLTVRYISPVNKNKRLNRSQRAKPAPQKHHSLQRILLLTKTPFWNFPRWSPVKPQTCPNTVPLTHPLPSLLLV